MTKTWFNIGRFPVSFPSGPIGPYVDSFDDLFVRISVYDKLDKLLSNIKHQHAKFWITSEGGGYGKSTMLHYIARWLILNIENSKSLPFLMDINLGRSDLSFRGLFIQEFLGKFLDFGNILEDMLGTIIKESAAARIIEKFNENSELINNLRNRVYQLNEAELDESFRILLSKINSWREAGLIDRIVLLIDEMDKLSLPEVREVLGKHQSMFETLCEDAGMITIIAGHHSWVDRVLTTTEYSYYQGVNYEIPPFVDLADVRQLIEGRQYQYAMVRRRDSPWKKNGLGKVVEITGGVPRRIVNLSYEILNYAVENSVEEIESDVVSSAVLEGEVGFELKRYLQKDIVLYGKMRNAIDSELVDLLVTFYSNPGHRIEKMYDDHLDLRTQDLGVELSNHTWLESIIRLQQLKCIIDEGGFRILSSDVIDLFNMMDHRGVHAGYLLHVLPQITAHVKVQGTRKPPNYRDSIERCFLIAPRKWRTKKEVYDYFRDSIEVELYAKEKAPIQWPSFIKRAFTRTWNRFVKEKSTVSIEDENGEIRYREVPESVNIEWYRKVASMKSFALAKGFVEISVNPYDDLPTIEQEVLVMISELFRILCNQKRIEFDSGAIFKKKKFTELVRELSLSKSLKDRTTHLLYELNAEDRSIDIIQQLTLKVLNLGVSTFLSRQKDIE